MAPHIEARRRSVYALIGFRYCPELTREVGAIGEVRLIVIRASVEDVQAHPGTAKRRGQADHVRILRQQDIPELTREVGTIGEVWLIVVWASVEDVQAHPGTAKQRR